MKIVIPGEMPGMNEIIDAAKQGRKGYQPYAVMKKGKHKHSNLGC